MLLARLADVLSSVRANPPSIPNIPLLKASLREGLRLATSQTELRLLGNQQLVSAIELGKQCLLSAQTRGSEADPARAPAPAF